MKKFYFFPTLFLLLVTTCFVQNDFLQADQPLVSAKRARENHFVIQVQHTSGKTDNYTIEPHMTIKDLKKEIAKKTTIPTHRQKLYIPYGLTHARQENAEILDDTTIMAIAQSHTLDHFLLQIIPE